MKKILKLLSLIAFSHGLAQEKNVPDSEDNILLAADVNKIPSADENPVPNLEDDGRNCNNVEQILAELNAERAKNRDLNHTISDILDRMADMEKNIMRNEEKITDNQSSVVLLSHDVQDLQEEVDGVTEDVERNSADITKVFEDVSAVQDDVTEVFEDVVSLTSSFQQQTIQIESLTSSDQLQASQIQSLGTRGEWCSIRKNDLGPAWTTIGTITYDRLTFSNSNNIPTGTPLDISTGMFTVPLSGVWRVTFSMESAVESEDRNIAYLFLNGHMLDETRHYTISTSGRVSSTSGLVVTLEASAGDTISLRTTVLDGWYNYINFCVEYLPKM